MKLEMQLRVRDAVSLVANYTLDAKVRLRHHAMPAFYARHSRALLRTPGGGSWWHSQILWMPQLLRTSGRDNGLGGGNSANCN